MPVSPPPNPDPVTVTEVPGAPLLWLKDMVPVTMKVTTGTPAGCVVEP
jgi:hypothetical protein